MKAQILWADKSQKEKHTFIIKTLVLSIFTIGVIISLILADKIFGENSVFNKNISSNGTINTLYHKIPALIKTIQILVFALLLSKFIRFLMRKLLSKTNRGITIVKLLDSFVKYFITIVALLAVLGAWGVDTATILASAGILGLVIGLGAQTLIADIIAGIFIVFEGDYQVGDIVVIDDWRGTVDEIGIRTTKIVDAGGNIKIVSNSEIKTIINQTKELSLAKCEIGIEYGESIERVESIISSNMEKLKERIPAIVEGPFYKGINTLNASSVDLLFVARCKEEDLFQTQRDIKRELKIIFDKNNINIPFPQVVLNQPTEFKTKVSAKTVKAAEEFVAEQKELSKDIEEKI